MLKEKTKMKWLDPGYSIWWSNEGGLPDEDYLKKIKSADIHHVETAIREAGYGPEPKAFEKRLSDVIVRFKSAGINVWSVHVPFGIETDISVQSSAETGMDIIKRQMETCAENGVDKIVVHGSYEPIPPEERQMRMECCIDSLDKLFRPDVAIAIETLPRTCLCNTTAETAKILKSLNGKIGCCVDVNHCQKEDVALMIKELGEFLITLHISDDDGLDEKHWYPGDGVLDWSAIIRALQFVDYKGVFMYEVGNDILSPNGIRENFNRLLKLKKADENG